MSLMPVRGGCSWAPAALVLAASFHASAGRAQEVAAAEVDVPVLSEENPSVKEARAPESPRPPPTPPPVLPCGAPGAAPCPEKPRCGTDPGETPCISYAPLYSEAADTERSREPVLGLHREFSDLNLWSIGASATYAGSTTGWCIGVNHCGVLGAEMSYVPFVSEGILWAGFLASYSFDFDARRHRLGAGLEAGVGAIGLDAAPLVKLSTEDGEGHWGLQTRFMLDVPATYGRPRYDRECCPLGSTLRACACAESFSALLLEPYLSLEVWPDGPEATARVFGGLIVKYGYAH